jgi:eukaryotic-like serine/threonine-protein kinase
MPHDPRKFEIGDQVPGTKWVACSKLGEGGMGVVWEVVKPPGIRGAMKMMLPHLATRSEFVSRFLGEVRLLATLEHTNIVRVYDCDVVDDGTPYLVMELLHGGTLRASMRHYGRTIPPDAAYDIIRGVGEGLDRAHSAGVVHRDVKPENTFLHCHENDRPRIVLLDFGIATLMEGRRKRGEVVGTPFYMAPEQLRGERETARTDIYAMGLMLYEMLTGRLPWDFTRASGRDIAHAHLYEPPAPATQFAPWVPRAVDRLIASALDKDPAKRPLDVFAFTSKLFHLQWCKTNANPTHINTTEPTLSTLADVSQAAARDGGQAARDTFQGMTPPPVDGRSLEMAGGETREGEPPEFSANSRAQAAFPPAATTKVPAGVPSVDRQAATAEPLPRTDPGPTHGTAALSVPPPPRTGLVRGFEEGSSGAAETRKPTEPLVSTPMAISRSLHEVSGLGAPAGAELVEGSTGERDASKGVAVLVAGILSACVVTVVFIVRLSVGPRPPHATRPEYVPTAAFAPPGMATSAEVASNHPESPPATPSSSLPPPLPDPSPLEAPLSHAVLASPLTSATPVPSVTAYATPSAAASAASLAPTAFAAPAPARPRPPADVRPRPLAAPAASSRPKLTDEQREVLELLRDKP